MGRNAGLQTNYIINEIKTETNYGMQVCGGRSFEK